MSTFPPINIESHKHPSPIIAKIGTTINLNFIDIDINGDNIAIPQNIFDNIKSNIAILFLSLLPLKCLLIRS